MKLKDCFILREIAGEHVVVPAGGDLDLNMMISLNDTGCTLWKKLAEGAEMTDLVSALVDKYDVDTATAQAHAAAFVEKLKENDFLQ